MKWVDRRLRELIMTSGVGYMANTATDKKRHNVRIQPLRLNVITSTVYLQQRSPIQRYEEIISPYNNKEAAKKEETCCTELTTFRRVGTKEARHQLKSNAGVKFSSHVS
jgi:hypothetical protein